MTSKREFGIAQRNVGKHFFVHQHFYMISHGLPAAVVIGIVRPDPVQRVEFPG
jgi:hypothetical protein